MDTSRAALAPRTPRARLDVTAQLIEMMRQLGSAPRADYTKRAEPGSPCKTCPSPFPRRINSGRDFDFSRQPLGFRV
jgi:hypothetical protein